MASVAGGNTTARIVLPPKASIAAQCRAPKPSATIASTPIARATGPVTLACVLTQGNRRECPVFDELPSRAVDAAGRLPTRLAADRGYSSDRVRNRSGELGVACVIPYRRTEHVNDRTAVDAEAYTGRNGVERCVGRLKRMRRLGTRFEKLAADYAAMLTLGMAVLYLRALA